MRDFNYNEHKSWGSKFIDNLAKDIKMSFPNVKGYSVRNLKYMAKFAAAYPDDEFVLTVSAQIPQLRKTPQFLALLKGKLKC